jgi:hypothetical protein
MAKKKEDAPSDVNAVGAKHELLVYRFIGARYRPAGVLLFIMGIVALLPTFIPALRFPTRFSTTNS